MSQGIKVKTTKARKIERKYEITSIHKIPKRIEAKKKKKQNWSPNIYEDMKDKQND